MDDAQTYPRLLRRVQAVLVDSLIFLFVIVAWWYALPLLSSLPPGVRIAIPIFAWILLDPVLVTFTGGSPGHHLRGLVVLSEADGAPLNLVRSLIRALVKSLTGWWAFIFVLMTRRHQALHDLVSGSIVRLRHPQALPVYERVAERETDAGRFRYPPRWRRFLVILVYLLVATLTLTVVQAWLFSHACYYRGICSPIDTAIAFITSLAWFIANGATIVQGWRSRLFGARRQPLEE